MSNRRESFFDVLLVLPWWVALLLGVGGYAAIVFIPQLVWTDGMLVPAAKSLRPVALAWLGLCLVAGVGSAIRSHAVSRIFDRQRGLDSIRAASWRQFESLVGEGFRRRGYSVLESAHDGADEDVDLVLRKNGAKFLVQCKHWKKSNVGVKPIRELLGVMTAHDAAGGFFVTSGTYTDEARRFAKETSIDLMDGAALEQLVLDARRPEPFMDPTEGRRQTGFKKVETEPTCPDCGGAMVKRTAMRGPHKGEDFWGCVQHPLCRGVRDA
jgi:restriction system protein